MISNTTTEAIDKFTTMVKRSMQSRAKDIRLDMTDATVLMCEMANILARLALHEQRRVTAYENTTAQMDAGGFGRDK